MATVGSLLLILIALPLRAFAAVEYNKFEILSLSHQSQGLSFEQWISVFTLCLAPLVAHIIAGVPKIVLLSHKRLSWHERIGLYNPTTILWRYFSITDRRIRARSWHAADMAASNACFWTPRGWDGSEELVKKTRAFCIKIPDSSHASLLSSSLLKTLIIALQGVSAAHSLLFNINTVGGYSVDISISTIFFPLGIFGLLRLFAASWLTDDYTYVELQPNTETINPESGLPEEKIQLAKVHTPSNLDLDLSDVWTGENYHPPNSWRAGYSKLYFSCLSLVLLP